LTVPLALFTVYVKGGGCLKKSYGEREWLKTSEYRHIRWRGSKIAQKPSYDI